MGKVAISSKVEAPLKKALQALARRTNSTLSTAIEKTLRVGLEHEEEVTEEIKLFVKASRAIDDRRLRSELQKAIMKGGYNPLNLDQAFRNIDNMNITLEKKERLRILARRYNESDSKDIDKLMEFAEHVYENVDAIDDGKIDTTGVPKPVIPAWKTLCRGCLYRGDWSACKGMDCRVMKGLKRPIDRWYEKQRLKHFGRKGK